VVRNYLVLLSSEFDETMVSWTPDDLVAHFDLEQLNTSATIFDPEKLRWMNGRFIREMAPEALAEALFAYLTRTGFFADDLPGDADRRLVRELAPLVQEKIELLAQFPARRFLPSAAVSDEVRARLAVTASAKETERAAVTLAR
jgi:glutamyl/glutaminyl-tRNA synthetase